MPPTRHRSRHSYTKKADRTSKQRTRGRTTLAVIFGAFGIIISLFATEGKNYVAMILGAAAGATLGYYLGKSMEQSVNEK